MSKPVTDTEGHLKTTRDSGKLFAVSRQTCESHFHRRVPRQLYRSIVDRLTSSNGEFWRRYAHRSGGAKWLKRMMTRCQRRYWKTQIKDIMNDEYESPRGSTPL